MFLKKRRLKYQDFINNVEMDAMPKPKNKPKVQALLDKINPPIEKIDKVKQEFIKPQTEDEWQKFHKMNEDGMKKAYESKEGYYKDNNKLFIAGTRDVQDVLDWPKIPLGTFQKSKIYKNVEPVFKEDDNINYVVGHSAGGSATLELENNFPNRKITSITYNAPIFERATTDIMDDLRDDNKPMRFASGWDPVSALDMNARTTYKAPEINLDIAKNISKVYKNPSLDNVINTVKSGFPDPLMGQHNMQGTYSNPSTAKDFIESGAKAMVAGNTLGAVVL
jgi:hypothetical protein